MIRIALPGGSVVELPEGTTAGQALEAVPEARGAVAASVDGAVVDLSRPLCADARIEPVLPGSPEALEVLRHTTAHVLAQAVARYFGMENVEFAIGPVIEEGFYYDFELPRQLVPEDLPKIESLMEDVRKEDLPIQRFEAASREDALRTIRADRSRSRFKQELVAGFPEGETVSFYRQGEFTDLCRGPHLPSTGRLAAFKVLSIAGAYWRGDSRREMLQRIYATAFFSKDELKEHLRRIEEAEKRDHRKLGLQLDLFRVMPEAPGFPLWMPNGTIVFNALVDEMRRKLSRRGYLEARTPHIMNADLWRRSGHWDHYRANMYVTQIEDRDFAVKPMNCPGAALVFSQGLRSYRELPFRLAEFGLCHRFEESGALAGMTRVRSFVQDDAHVFCTLDQVPLEIRAILDLIHETYRELGMTEIEMCLATRPADRTGTDAMWDQAEAALASALRDGGYSFRMNPGDGAFYGPKIDFRIRDALGRGHQTATCQLDFSLPEKFGLEYVAEDGARRRPVVIHRAIYGSIERFFAILIEHFGGAFPLWLAPEQAVVVPVSEERHAGAAKAALDVLRAAGLRASVDWSNHKLGKKIREVSLRKVPYALVVGDREADAGTVAVRRRDGTDCGAMPVERVRDLLVEEALSRALHPSIAPPAPAASGSPAAAAGTAAVGTAAESTGDTTR